MRYFLIAMTALLMTGAVQAQVSVALNFNLDRQPVWGPTGYDHVEYYYLPDIGAYYNVSQQKFYYNERGHWIGRSQLPSRYHDVNLYNSYKVVVNDPKPYQHDDKYKAQFATYKGRHDQQSIRDSREEKYFSNKNHPEHKNWLKQQRAGHGKGNGQEDKHQSNERH
jgi:hypothetical protein